MTGKRATSVRRRFSRTQAGLVSALPPWNGVHIIKNKCRREVPSRRPMLHLWSAHLAAINSKRHRMVGPALKCAINAMRFPFLGFVQTTWVAYKTKEGDTYYFNTDTLDGSWDEPADFNPDSAQLTKEELQVSIIVTQLYFCICGIHGEVSAEMHFFFSCVRMCTLRKRTGAVPPRSLFFSRQMMYQSELLVIS